MKFDFERPDSNPVQELFDRFMHDASPEFLACVSAGIPMECRSERVDGAVRVTMETTERVGFRYEGNEIHVVRG